MGDAIELINFNNEKNGGKKTAKEKRCAYLS